MTWAVERRLDYIDWRLLVCGEMRREDLVRTFGISMSQASNDIRKFIAAYPTAAAYDKNGKRYIPANGRYVTRRGWTPSVLRSLDLMARRGHPMAWRE